MSSPNSSSRPGGNASRAIALASVLALASAAAVYAVFTLMRAGLQVSITSYPVRVSMQLRKAEFQQGEIINVTLSLTNISNETVTLWKSHFYFYIDKVMLFDYIVRDSNGTKLYQWTDEYFHAPSTWSTALEPSEQWVNEDTFFAHHYGLQPGVYSIVGLLHNYSINGGPLITLETPSITFRVRRATPLSSNSLKATVTTSTAVFSVELMTPELLADQNFTLRFLLMNTGNQTITVYKPSCCSPSPSTVWSLSTRAYKATSTANAHQFHFDSFEILAADGTLLLDHLFVGPCESTYQFAIEPGGYLEQTLTFSFQYWLSVYGFSQPILKGTYLLRGVLYYLPPTGRLETLPLPFIIR